ncbi:MAG: DUF2065 domain-containing protein [Mariprofundales bacterium]|nr:DUF2065 domain-containing protein [Mariprofundales bacterium]
MDDLGVAMGLVLVFEGALYALFPNQMIAMAQKLPEAPPAALRAMGLLSVAIGWLCVKLIRS